MVGNKLIPFKIDEDILDLIDILKKFNVNQVSAISCIKFYSGVPL